MEDTAGLHECEAIQVEAWGYGDLETVPASQLKAVQQAAGMVLGAYRDGRMVGFAYGFLARDLERMGKGDGLGAGGGGIGLHSHMVAVRPEQQNAGVGRRLKWAQRDWCLARGLPWMHWTFDPMQARNARLNLHHLGGTSRCYLVDFYGVIGGRLSGSQPTDRLLVQWDLLSSGVVERARRFAAGEPLDTLLAAEPPIDGAARLLTTGPDGSPDARSADVLHHRALATVAVPADATTLLRDAPSMARAWRLAVREAMLEALRQGFRVTRFVDGAYLLERSRVA